MPQRTYYPEFWRRTNEYRTWLADRRSLLEEGVGITSPSTQATHLDAIQAALNAITPANGWPNYKEGP